MNLGKLRGYRTPSPAYVTGVSPEYYGLHFRALRFLKESGAGADNNQTSRPCRDSIQDQRKFVKLKRHNTGIHTLEHHQREEEYVKFVRASMPKQHPIQDSVEPLEAVYI